MSNLISIGLISYNDLKYLKIIIPSLLSQSYKNIEILLCDNNTDPHKKIATYIKNNFPSVKIIDTSSNLGFAKGHNLLIQKAKGDFYLCYNSDLYADPNLVVNLLKPFHTDSKIATTSGKVLKWSTFPSVPTAEKNHYFDTTGLVIHQNHIFSDRGQLQKDAGQFDTQSEIWGPSGACVLFNLKLLKKLEHSKNEIFDNSFFMYKEDVDLAYRVRWAGYKCIYVPTAIAYHDRTIHASKGLLAQIKNRRNRPDYAKHYSFFNQLRVLYKNYSFEYSLITHCKTIVHLIVYLLYILICDFKRLKVLILFYKDLPNLRKKRATAPRAISAKQMELWFNKI